MRKRHSVREMLENCKNELNETNRENISGGISGAISHMQRDNWELYI